MRLVLLALILAISSFAIVIDTAVPGFTPGNSVFTGVAAILFTNASSGTSVCTGSLIAADLILTAGHCLAGASNWQVTFHTPTSNATIAASQSYLHPNYGPRPAPVNTIAEYDVGILRLASIAPADAEIYGIKTDYTGLFTNTWLDLVGYGLYGVPGAVPTLNVSQRHWARNTVDFLASSISGAPSPDLPLYMTANFSTAAPDEGLVNGGDSGGPMLFGNFVLGVASAGDLPRTTAVDGSTTYSSLHANLAEPVTGEWVQSFLVPEPGTMLLAGLGLAAIVIRRRANR